jgi:CubicO group peptidase (beta-lactamase class C family)
MPSLRLPPPLDLRQRFLLTDGSQLSWHRADKTSDRLPDEWQRAGTDPAAAGMQPELVEDACKLVRQRGVAAQLCVIRRGQVVVDRGWASPPDSLFWIFSASKPFTAVLVHRLAERGLFELDDRIAEHWPAFGRHGKSGITIRHVLQHRTGFDTTGSSAKDIAVSRNWNRAIHAIEETRPRRPAGSDPAYQFLIFGFILGELIQRVTGRLLPDVMEAEIFAPLGLAHSFLQVTDADWPRHVPVRCRHRGGLFAEAAINQRATRRAVIPAAGISTTAANVARFYDALLNPASDDAQLIGAQALHEARRQTTDGEIDQRCGSPMPWSHGFQLGGPRDAAHLSPMGQLSTRQTFGHNGSNCCIAWADPDRQLAVAYLNSTRIHRDFDVPHLAEVADLLFASCQE